ncbi:hypothetical protein BS17DRAFT_65515 [Gyrodon lividus]|nr:hypothetical protein BS17DRAFT_65515 [Gyrodon lividus]
MIVLTTSERSQPRACIRPSGAGKTISVELIAGKTKVWGILGHRWLLCLRLTYCQLSSQSRGLA